MLAVLDTQTQTIILCFSLRIIGKRRDGGNEVRTHFARRSTPDSQGEDRTRLPVVYSLPGCAVRRPTRENVLYHHNTGKPHDQAT